jgi:hypothetical protein
MKEEQPVEEHRCNRRAFTQEHPAENGGTLTHSAVARRLGVVAAVQRNRPEFAASAALEVDPHWGNKGLCVVAFVQEREPAVCPRLPISR